MTDPAINGSAPRYEFEVTYERGMKKYGPFDCVDEADALKKGQSARESGRIPSMLRADFWVTIYEKSTGIAIWSVPLG